MTEKERKKDLRNRFEGLKDKNMAYYALHSGNYAVWLEKQLEDPDYAKVEQLMKDLEAKDAEFEPLRQADKTREQEIKDATIRLKALDLSSVDPNLKDILIVLRSM